MLQPRSEAIATYSLCGFANPGSIGCLVATLNTLVPSQRKNTIALAFRAFVGGCIVCFLTACVAGMCTMRNNDIPRYLNRFIMYLLLESQYLPWKLKG